MNKEKTALQLAIEEIEELRQIAIDKSLYYEASCYLRSISILKAKLPTYKEQIEKAYDTGSEHGFNDEDKSGKNYYNETFENSTTY